MSDIELVTRQTMLISELLIRISSLERVLLKKGLLTQDEIGEETKGIISQLNQLTEKFVMQENQDKKEQN